MDLKHNGLNKKGRCFMRFEYKMVQVPPTIEVKAKEQKGPYKDYSGKKVTVRTVRAIDCNLCGKQFQFRYEMKEHDNGAKEKVGCEYVLDSKDYGNSFNEIIHKLTRYQNKVVEIIGVE